MNEIEKNRLNWDNNFSIRFKLENGKSLERIPNNIFEIDMPEINTKDVNEENIEKYIALVLRSTQDGLVEKEVYDVLFRTNFDIELSLSNPNKVDYIYKSCSVEKINFAPLMYRPKANPFNFTIWAKVSQIIYKGASEPIIFGKSFVNPISYDIDEKGDLDE